VLSNYGDAFAVGFDMTNMSNLIIDEGVNGSLINVTHYQTSQALAERAQELFNSEQMNASIAASGVITDQSVDNIAAAMEDLVTDIGSKKPPKGIMTIVHTKLHPNFLAAFNLNPAIH
jgi:hypothetical protein